MNSTQPSWKTLLAIAIRGTDRAEDDWTAEKLLVEASRLALERKAGFPLERWEGEGPEPLSQSERNVCSAEATAYLQRMLSGQYQAALPEFVQWLQQTRQELPPSILPGLLEACLDNERLHELASPLLKGRGNWLAEQHPEWSRLLYARPSPVTLTTAWESLKADEKLALLQPIPLPFLPEDRDWLEVATEDRSQRVQTLARRSLVTIPGHTLQDEALDWLNSRFAGKKTPPSDQLAQLNPPEKDEKALVETLLSLIDPEVVFPSGEYLLPLLADMPTPWIEAILRAGIEYRSASILKKILAHRLKQNGQSNGHSQALVRAANELSRKDFNQILVEAFTRRKELLKEDAPLFRVLARSVHQWDDALTRAALDPLKAHLRSRNQVDWRYIHYRSLIEAAAYRIRPRFLSTLMADWPAMGYRQMEWIEALEKVENVVAFRVGFIETLRKGNP